MLDAGSDVDGVSSVDAGSDLDGASTITSGSDFDGASTIDAGSDYDGASTIDTGSDVDGVSSIDAGSDIGASTITSGSDVDLGGTDAISGIPGVSDVPVFDGSPEVSTIDGDIDGLHTVHTVHHVHSVLHPIVHTVHQGTKEIVVKHHYLTKEKDIHVTASRFKGLAKKLSSDLP